MSDPDAPPDAIDRLPGYRRRFVVAPEAGSVRTELEDDYHCMAVTLRHADGVVTAVEPVMHRVPWTTCPGAVAKLAETFAGTALVDVAGRGEKSVNCTHLHDLATLAAIHAADHVPTVYDVLVSDPIDGLRRAEVRRDGGTILAWLLDGFTIVAPADSAGIELMKLKPLLERLTPLAREAAKMLRQGAIVGSGRSIPLSEQSDASRVPPVCFTFQPAMVTQARRVGVIRDFSAGTAQLLDGHERRPRYVGAPA